MEAVKDYNAFLIISTLFIFIFAKFIPKISEWLSQRFWPPKEKELAGITEIIQIKKQLNSISMADEFAKYSKLQRKLNLLTLDVDSTVEFRHNSQVKLGRVVKIGAYVLTALCNILFLYKYGSQPVFIVPPEWFYPLNFSIPTSIAGAISIPFWLLFVKNSLDNLI